MEENQILFAKVENTPMEQYLSVSKMKELGTWGQGWRSLHFLLCATQLFTYIAIVAGKDGGGCLINL